MKTTDLQGAALDWAVAKCEGVCALSVNTDIDGTKRINYGGMYPEWSTDWAQGGPIIEREGISLEFRNGDWIASYAGFSLRFFSYDPLVSAMRCYVAAKLGDEIEVPEEVAA